MAQVVLDRVSKTFPGGVVAVREASLTVEPGEFMVVVGPSGCGKSTTLRMVAGLEDVTQGTISIDGRVVNDVAPKDRDIAMVFQNYALYPHMSVYDNMAFGLKMRKMPKKDINKRVREAAELLELTPLLERKPKALSGGQRQRVAVGRAIVRHPKVFLFDEPLSNLDAKLRVQMRAEISKLHRRLHATTIYVTHDQVEAMTMGTRITLMKDGVIQQIDEPLTIYRRPANQFVATVSGSPAMNIIPGRIVRDGAAQFTAGSIAVPLPQWNGTALPEEASLGIRPEDVHLDRVDGPTLEATVEIVEPLGSEVFLHVRAADVPLVARVGVDQPPRVGERIRLRLDSRKLHLFDPRTGQAIHPHATSRAP
ncbi:MAG TPA: sn-glycerol-3-phosphate ABC transporter ATP-binding protein UgpC [bacterium]|nr:sn-glycerol-3-phosphate ABC transporter ATP-binding protein UgpC [bacterium]